MQERLDWLLGNKIEIIKNKTILIIGLGGVGSYALETLTRMFIKKIIIVDNDIIDISNLNRQIMTNINNIGKYKTDVWEDRIKSINPQCEIVKINNFITKDNISELFKEKIDYLIDACDTIDTKKEIIKYCLENKIKFISSMGMGKRIDATKIKISYLAKTINDPLSKKMRFLIKKENIKGKIPVIYSEELPLKIEKLGSISYVPAMAGLLCTNYVINDILKGIENE